MASFSIWIFLFTFLLQNAEGKFRRVYKVKHLEVPVDHFNFGNTKTFNMKYLINDTFWDSKNGPIFFYTGNEGQIEFFAEHTGFIWEIAVEFRALIVYAEHRYYGDSMPFGARSLTTPEFTGYLSTSQALADYADLVTFLQKGREVPYPVVLFGGSYGGMLAAYFRMKYPHLSVGAIASSAPIFQYKVPCERFYKMVSNMYEVENKTCYNNTRRSFQAIRNITRYSNGKLWLFKEWHLCKKLENDKSIQGLIDWLKDALTTLTVANYPYESDFLIPLPPNPVGYYCNSLSSNNITLNTDLLKAMYAGLRFFTNGTCIDWEKSAGSPYIGTEAWNFQSCTEMVMPMCTNGVDDMFEPKPWDEKKFSDTCKARWGVTPSFDLSEKMYGGKNMTAASNIVFSNGILDPWMSGGVVKKYGKWIFPLLILQGAHIFDLMERDYEDPPSITAARSQHRTIIRRWIGKT